MNSGLKVLNLTKIRPGFKVTASFEVAAGKLLAIMGPSGVGKSTLLRMIAGLESSDSGSVELSAEGLVVWSQLPVQKRRVGYLAQDLGLFDTHTVGANVEFGLKMQGIAPDSRALVAAEWLAKVGLAGFATRHVDTLSGGERQRVALARLFASGPRVLLLDEPFSALDSSLRKELKTLVLAYIQEKKIPALMVTHEMIYEGDPHQEVFTLKV